MGNHNSVEVTLNEVLTVVQGEGNHFNTRIRRARLDFARDRLLVIGRELGDVTLWMLLIL